MASLIPAAGTVPWRRRDDRLEVAIVHRPKYDDWSWAKGKLDPGEPPSACAARETLEETGLVVRLGVPLPTSEYAVLDPLGSPATKQVHYWAAEVVGGTGALEHEIDEVAWVDVRTANDRLDYTRDREQLLALVRADREGDLETWPVVLVRHAKAVPRGRWAHDDRARPLDAVGRAQAAGLMAVLTAYGVVRLKSSTSRRCLDTLEPYAAARGLRIRSSDVLSEEGYADDPSGAPASLDKLLQGGRPVALCSHGPVLPPLVHLLADRVPADHRQAEWLAEQLGAAADSGLRKGEALVCHLTGIGHAVRVVAVERVFT